MGVHFLYIAVYLTRRRIPKEINRKFDTRLDLLRLRSHNSVFGVYHGYLSEALFDKGRGQKPHVQKLHRQKHHGQKPQETKVPKTQVRLG